MTYMQYFVAAVPTERKEDYIAMARGMWSFFRERGALSTIECWEEDVPDGEKTSFPMAVQREEGESIVCGSMTWRDKASFDAAMGAMMSDPEFANMEMPFDGSRMFWGGFTPIFQKG